MARREDTKANGGAAAASAGAADGSAPAVGPPEGWDGVSLPPDMVQSQQAMIAALTAAWQEITRVRAEHAEHVELLQRLQAEFQNYKKRAKKEKAEFQKKASENLIVKLLDVVDNFERGMRSPGDPKDVLKGIGMVHKQFLYVMEQEGLTTVPAEGAEFDPSIHDAIAKTTNPELPDRTVVEEISRGYMLKDKVLRPARVKVNIVDKAVLEAAEKLEAEAEAEGATAEEALSAALASAVKQATAAKVRAERLKKEKDEEMAEARQARQDEEEQFLQELAEATGMSVEELRESGDYDLGGGGGSDTDSDSDDGEGAESSDDDPESKGEMGNVTHDDLADDILGDL